MMFGGWLIKKAEEEKSGGRNKREEGKDKFRHIQFHLNTVCIHQSKVCNNRFNTRAALTHAACVPHDHWTTNSILLPHVL